MSRHTIFKNGLQIAYGFDDIPMGGYFFQVFDMNKQSEDDEGLIVNEGFFKGIGKTRMMELMEEYHIDNETHISHVAMDLPI